VARRRTCRAIASAARRRTCRAIAPAARRRTCPAVSGAGKEVSRSMLSQQLTPGRWSLLTSHQSRVTSHAFSPVPSRISPRPLQPFPPHSTASGNYANSYPKQFIDRIFRNPLQTKEKVNSYPKHIRAFQNRPDFSSRTKQIPYCFPIEAMRASYCIPIGEGQRDGE